MTNRTIGTIGGALFISVGTTSLVAPHSLLRTTKQANDEKPWANNVFYRSYVRPEVYVPVTRLVGAIAVLVGLLLLVLVWFVFPVVSVD
jgi:hypothetical protein